MPDDEGAQVPEAVDAPVLSEGGASAFPADADNGGEPAPALEWSGEPPGSDAELPTPAPAPSSTAAAAPAPSPPAAAAEPEPEPEPEPASAGSWAVQVGSFSSRANADRLSEWCREQGYGVRVLSGQDGAGTLYRVRVGPYASRGDARSAVAELALLGRKGFVSAWENASP